MYARECLNVAGAAIAQHGSISAAARALGMSYRRAWLRVETMNRSVREPLVTTLAGGKHGGGTQLTAMGEQVLQRYRHLCAQALAAVLADPPAFVPGSDPDWRQVLCGPYALDTSAPRLVENFLDLSHFGFVHEGWLGERSHAQVQTGAVEEGEAGLVVRDARAWQPRAYAGADAGAWIAYRYDVPHPYAAILRKDATEGDPVSNAIALFIRPDSATGCTAWFAMATLGDLSDDEELRAFQDAVFAQDRPIVESQVPKTLPIGQDGPINEVHSPADRMSSAYRRYLARLGVSLGVC